MANPQHKMEAMAQSYGLKDGKFADYYNLHGQWCVTKGGAKKIARQEGITHTKPDGEMNNSIVYFSAVFTDSKGRSAWEIGSCRFDGTKNTPERSHAPEMAVKRMFVRGVLALIEADGIYGSDEFDSSFHEKGNNNQAPQPTGAPYTETATTAYIKDVLPVKVKEQTAQPANPDGTRDYQNDSRIPPAGTQGWWDKAWELPKQWNAIMGKLAEHSGDDRSKWEKLVFDACATFQFTDGSGKWWKCSNKYPNFESYVYSVDPNTGKSKAGASLQVLKKAKEMIDTFCIGEGTMTLEVPNADAQLEKYECHSKGKRDFATNQGAKQLVAEFDAEDVVTHSQSPKEHDVPF